MSRSVFCHHIQPLVYYCHVWMFCVFLPVYYSFIFCWYSHIESASFVIVYHSCVPIPTWHKKKYSMSRLTNPITATFFITGIRLLFFYNFFIIVFDVNWSNWVSTDSQHKLFPLLIRTHWTHTYIYIRMYVSKCTCTYSLWYVYTCTHMCTFSYLCCIYMHICMQMY